MSEGDQKETGNSALLPGIILVTLIVVMGLRAEWVLSYVEQAVETVMNPSIYIDAVFKRGT
ncbi:putative monovalent cation/H+ antiporter subunit D [compost metagenome]